MSSRSLIDGILEVRLQAQLYPENRSASRMIIDRPVTLRPDDNRPIDAVIENLSRTGFGMVSSANLAIGAVVGLSVAGAPRRNVKIVRRTGLAYGCEFISPLSDLELSAALQSQEVVSANFISGDPKVSHASRGSSRKFSYLARAYILVGLVIVLWSILLVLFWLFFE